MEPDGTWRLDNIFTSKIAGSSGQLNATAELDFGIVRFSWRLSPVDREVYVRNFRVHGIHRICRILFVQQPAFSERDQQASCEGIAFVTKKNPLEF